MGREGDFKLIDPLPGESGRAFRCTNALPLPIPAFASTQTMEALMISVLDLEKKILCSEKVSKLRRRIQDRYRTF